MKSLLWPAAFGIGLVVAAQMAMNAAVAARVDNLRLNNAVFWVSGGLAALVLGLTRWDPQFASRAREVPWWLWGSGVMGAVIVIVIAWLILRLGAGATNVLMLAGQVIGSLLVAHYGLLGTPTDRLTPIRVAGVALMLTGAVIAIAGKTPGRP